MARRGQIVLDEAVGFAERASERKARRDDGFCLFSVTKTFTSGAVLARVDRGETQLTTSVAVVPPEFGPKGKRQVDVGHLLTLPGGMSSGLPPIPVDKLGDLATVAAAVSSQPLLSAPGRLVSYDRRTARVVPQLREAAAALGSRPVGARGLSPSPGEGATKRTPHGPERAIAYRERV